MRIVIEDIIDITDVTIDAGQDTARFSEITGILQPERDFLVDDSTENLSPFLTNGILNPDVNGWVDKEIKVFDDDDVLQYFGHIIDVIANKSRNKNEIIIRSREGIGLVIEAPIESVDDSTHSGFLLDGDHGKGTSQLLVKGGSTDIPDLCILTYTDTLVPNYQITNPQGSPTVNFDLDRGIETDLLNNQVLTINVPVEKTAAAEFKDALVLAYAAIGLQNRVNEALFDALDSEASALNHKLIFYIRLENNIRLGPHLNNISKMTGIYVRRGDDGRVEPVNEIQWNGFNPIKTITDDEIMFPQQKTFDRKRALFGYSLPYKILDQIRLESLVLANDDERLIDWRARPIHKLDTYIDVLPVKNPYLYNNQTTAKFYGDKFLNYYSIARERLNCTLNARFGSGELIGMKLFDDFLLTTDEYVNEPIKCLNYEFDDDAGLYRNVIFELINKGFPDLPTP